MAHNTDTRYGRVRIGDCQNVLHSSVHRKYHILVVTGHAESYVMYFLVLSLCIIDHIHSNSVPMCFVV